MKRNKILSMVLSIAMIMSCFTAVVKAEGTDGPTPVTLPFRLDFDDNDTRTDYELGNLQNGVETPTLVDGCWDAETATMGYNCPAVWLTSKTIAATDSNDGGIVLSEHENLVVRTRFKIGTDNTKPISLQTRIFGVRDYHVNSAFWVWCYNGVFAYGKKSSNNQKYEAAKTTVITDYKMYQGTWYTIEAVYKKGFGWVANVIPDEGEAYYGTVAGGTNWSGIKRIKMIDFFNTNEVGKGVHSYIDYVEIYDPNQLVKPTVTYNGADLNGAKDLPESFDAQMVFGSAITEADLGAITIDNGATLEKTLSNDGKTVTLKISNVVNGLTYTLKSSKIGLNADSETVFIAKEPTWVIYKAEFDGNDATVDNAGAALADFYTYKSDTDKSNIPVSNIKNGELVINNGGGQPRLYMLKDLSGKIKTGSTILWETRMKITKYKGGITAVDGVDYVNASATNALLRIGENAGIAANGGYFAYIDSQGATNTQYTVTDYLLKAGEYYTYRIEYDTSNQKARFSVEHDTDGKYTSDWVWIDLGATTQAYKEWRFGYIYHHTVAMDYTRIYDLSALPTPSIKLSDGTDLDGAEELPADSTVTVTFENAITNADLDAITIDNDATLVKELSADGKTVTISFENYGFGKNYTLNVNMIGANGPATAKFTSEKIPETGILLSSGDELDGQINISKDTQVKIVFPESITESDLEKITINNGATLSKALSADGKTVIVDVKNLKARTSYTLSVAAIGNNTAKSATFMSADDAWILYRAEFDGNDAFAPIEGGGSIANGVWNTPALNTNMTAILNISEKPVNLTGLNNVRFETRVKWDNRDDNDATVPNDILGGGRPILRILKQDSNSVAQVNMKDGVLYTGGLNTNGGNTATDITLYENKWYIVEITEFANKNSFKIKITDEETGEIYTATGSSGGSKVDVINQFSFGYRAQKGATVDYVRVINDDLLPAPEILLNGEKLNGQKRVSADEFNLVTVKFSNPITEEDLSKIKIDGKAFESAMLEDEYTVSMILEGCEEPRSAHTITVAAIGENQGAEATFRMADEGKYYLKAEFDGNDDDSVFYAKSSNYYEKLSNDSSRIKDGIMSHAWSDGNYRQLVFPLDMDWEGKDSTVKNTMPLDVADKTNIKIDTRIKWGAEGAISHRGVMIDNYLAYLTIKDGCFNYGADSNGNGGSNFEREGEPITVERDTWYDISFTLNFKNQVYCINIIRDGEADVYSSPWISMSKLSGKEKSTINEIGFAWHNSQGYAPVYIDYLRVSDENYGGAEVTYGDGVTLANSALVPVSGETVEITLQQEVYSASGITLKEVGGNYVSINPVANGSKVITIQLPKLKYDTKYELFVPISISGALKDQKITFRTVHDSSAELSLPAEFAAENFTSDNKLQVAYFGGSITANDGWRNIVEDWFDETYGADKVNHHNVSIGGTGSSNGRIRLYKDVVSKNPDIVFVEFAVNDASDYSADYNMESIVRALNTLENPPVIIYVYTTVRNFEKNNGSIELHDKVAEAYGIPVINIRDFVMSKANTDAEFMDAWNNTNDYIGSDNTHPAQGASDLYGNYVTSLLTANASKYFVHAKSNDEVDPIANGTDYFFQNTEREEDAMNDVGGSYTFTANGDEVLVEFKRTAGEGGIAEIAIDGIVKGTVNTYYASYVPNILSSYSGLGNGEHTITITITGKSDNSASYTVDVVRTYEAMALYRAPKFTTPQFDSNSITAEVDIKMTTSYTAYNSDDVTLVIALYDADDRFVRMVKTETSIGKGEGELELVITPKAGEVKAKAFIWDSVTGMKPFTENASIGF